MVKTLTAMANTDCTKNVYIIIGIADNENAVKDFENHYNVHCVTTVSYTHLRSENASAKGNRRE